MTADIKREADVLIELSRAYDDILADIAAQKIVIEEAIKDEYPDHLEARKKGEYVMGYIKDEISFEADALLDTYLNYFEL